jgi:hypothetical protein
MALTDKQEIAVERAWGVGLGQTARVPDRIPSEHRTLITGALRLAAEQYRKDATASAETPRVAEQFTMQADLCEKIAELVEL